MNTNHHAHTRLSDGVGEPEEYVLRAIAEGLIAYGFSDHAPIPLDAVGSMSDEELVEYGLTIDRLRTEYAGRIDLYKSLEVDYIPGLMNVDSAHIVAAGLDYTLGAVHYVDYLEDGLPWSFQRANPAFEAGIDRIFGGNARRMVERYYALVREMVATHPPDVVAHLDRIKKRNVRGSYWDEHSAWYRAAVEETLEAVAGADVILEVNTRGIYLHDKAGTYPSDWIIGRAHERGIRMQVNSDAHQPEHINGGFAEAYSLLHDLGVEAVWTYTGEAFEPREVEALTPS